MKVLLVGGGGREHAIAKAILRSNYSAELFAYLDIANPGITRVASDYSLGSLNDIASLAVYAERIKPDIVIFGPEVCLAGGAVDVLESKGMRCLGPTRAQARIESDKSFMRNFMKRYVGRGSPRWRVVRDANEVREFLALYPNAVIKPFGLTGGKGVKVLGRQLHTHEEAMAYANELISRDGGCLLEERVLGEEFSLMVFTDGKRLCPMPLVQDYKYAHEGDTGPMTGGMGSYSDSSHLLPFVTQKDFDNALSIMNDVIRNLSQLTKTPYRGVLYGQFMKTEHGPILIEFNARFGDPEAINVLALLETDFLELCLSIAEGEMVDRVHFRHQATVCKYLVPKGYPDQPMANIPVLVPEFLLHSLNPEIYLASVNESNGIIFTTKSRTLALLAVAATPWEAKRIVDETLNSWNPEGLYYRRDIPRLGGMSQG